LEISIMHLTLMFQSTGPGSFPYLILGYVIIGAVGLGYTISLWWRQRSLKRDLDVIERLQSSDE
jgi:hypothetical protein